MTYKVEENFGPYVSVVKNDKLYFDSMLKDPNDGHSVPHSPLKGRSNKYSDLDQGRSKSEDLITNVTI